MRFNIKDIVTKNWLFLLLIAVAAFLRFYRLSEFTMFLSDQGRDAIIIRDIVTLKHWPAIGASSSVGQIYLGPFYYYLIAPFLLFFNFNPVGLSYGTAILSLIGIITAYLIADKLSGKITAIIFTVFIVFSTQNVEQSRFSWNPNLLPFFSFLTLFFFYKMISRKKWYYSVLFGAFFSFCIQLHYLAILIIVPLLLIMLIYKIPIITNLVNFLVSFFSFIVATSPLIIFDLRHNFINFHGLIKLLTHGELASHTSYLNRFNDTITAFFSFATGIKINFLFSILILLLIGAGTVLLSNKKNRNWLVLNLLNVFSFLLLFSFMNTSRIPHYYGAIYLSFYLLAAYIIVNLLEKLPKFFTLLLIALLVVIYIIINSGSYYFLTGTGNNQIAYSQKIGYFLADKIGSQPFNIATWPVIFTEDNFIYFLELKGHIPADRNKVEITNQMFVLCNQQPCQVIDSPSWNISMFGPAKIDKIWKIYDITIYRLIHR